MSTQDNLKELNRQQRAYERSIIVERQQQKQRTLALKQARTAKLQARKAAS